MPDTTTTGNPESAATGDSATTECRAEIELGNQSLDRPGRETRSATPDDSLVRGLAAADGQAPVAAERAFIHHPHPETDSLWAASAETVSRPELLGETKIPTAQLTEPGSTQGTETIAKTAIAGQRGIDADSPGLDEDQIRKALGNSSTPGTINRSRTATGGADPAATRRARPRDFQIDVLLAESDWSDHLAELTRLGLTSPQPWTPPVWFYDERGSDLFDQITRLPEYYPTRAERQILRQHSQTILDLGQPENLVELGSGTSEKTHLLLAAGVATGRLRQFTPVDCSIAPLEKAGREIAAQYPSLQVRGVVGDFTAHLPHVTGRGRTMLTFLGSTIGHFSTYERRLFLKQVASELRSGDTFLLGTDLVKPVDRLLAAYDDAAAVTALFNLNALSVMNEQLGADFDPRNFKHESAWDADESRIEMRLVSRCHQSINVAGLGLKLDLAPGEWIQTEISTKFSTDAVAAELTGVGLQVAQQWTDADGDFALTLARQP